MGLNWVDFFFLGGGGVLPTFAYYMAINLRSANSFAAFAASLYLLLLLFEKTLSANGYISVFLCRFYKRKQILRLPVCFTGQRGL